GRFVTDHMVTLDYSPQDGWHGGVVGPYAQLTLDPSATVLHYGQSIFEGLKAYRHADGTINSFRPEANARRFQTSAHRLAMPELPQDAFVESLRRLLSADRRWVPEAGGEDSLYLRPFMIATDNGLGVSPSDTYRYLLIAAPAGAYFPRAIKPVSVCRSREDARAAPVGRAAANFHGNDPPSPVARADAAEQGCDQVVWLDALEREYIEEMGGMNLFFVFGSGSDARLVTPSLSGSLLPGISRDSLLQLAADAGYGVEERRISAAELEKGCSSGEITEVFACGTAAVITPVGRVKHSGGEVTVAGGAAGHGR